MNPSQLMQTRLNQLANSGLNFEAPKEEMDLIIKIVARIMNKWGPNVVPKLLAMELTACHLNGTRLNLEALSNADDQHLQADVFGIRRHIDRDTGKLKEGYLPVYAASLGCDYQGRHFGANYEDACCIDGYLWDLDSCEEPGGPLYSGGDIPCPRCNKPKYDRYVKGGSE